MKSKNLSPAVLGSQNSGSGPSPWCRAWPRGLLRPPTALRGWNSSSPCPAPLHRLLPSLRWQAGKALCSLRFALGLWVHRTAPTEPWGCSGAGAFRGWLLALQLVFAIGSATGISDCPLKNGVLPLHPEKGVRDSYALVPEEGSAAQPQGSLLLTFPTLWSPSSTRHHGRWDGGQPGATSGVSSPCSLPCRSSHHTAAHCTTSSCRAAAGWKG